jgi:hypothetical protein
MRKLLNTCWRIPLHHSKRTTDIGDPINMVDAPIAAGGSNPTTDFTTLKLRIGGMRAAQYRAAVYFPRNSAFSARKLLGEA